MVALSLSRSFNSSGMWLVPGAGAERTAPEVIEFLVSLESVIPPPFGPRIAKRLAAPWQRGTDGSKNQSPASVRVQARTPRGRARSFPDQFLPVSKEHAGCRRGRRQLTRTWQASDACRINTAFFPRGI